MTVEDFYDQDPHREWERLERHRTEHAVTLRVFNEYLPQPPARVLDIGGGPGRYAIALAGQGYDVTVVDLSEKLLEYARRKAGEAGVELAGYVHADALDLSSFERESFDVVLLMGPLYHLIRPRERQKAVREAARVLTSEGLVLASFITRYSPVRYAAQQEPSLILDQAAQLEEMLTTGIHIARTGGKFTDAYFALPSEIRPLMEGAGFATLDLVACEGVVSRIDEQINTLTGDLWGWS
jgi:ubiquinone/menaquinone biosynthesis C-methylase UbiE